jgi:predicted AAA+ superfamily ATPase
LLTDSSSVRKDVVSHSGAGRFGKIRMRTMSLYESSHSSGKISLIELFSSNLEISFESDKTINDIAKYIVCGGWPENINIEEKKSIRSLLFYYDILINEDIKNIDGVKRNPHTVDSLLKSFSRNISTLSKYTTILEDMKNNSSGIDIKTLDDYINALEKLFVIESIEA